MSFYYTANNKEIEELTFMTLTSFKSPEQKVKHPVDTVNPDKTKITFIQRRCSNYLSRSKHLCSGDLFLLTTYDTNTVFLNEYDKFLLEMGIKTIKETEGHS